MKKIILVVLMAVMIASPCLAEVEPEGLFSVDGTLWSACGMAFSSLPPFLVGMGCWEMGFYQGQEYNCNNNSCSPTGYRASYVDLGVVSIAYDVYPPAGGKWIGQEWAIFLAIMQPSIGLGVYSQMIFHPGWLSPFWGWSPPSLDYDIGIMQKINDNWTPPGIE